MFFSIYSDAFTLLKKLFLTTNTKKKHVTLMVLFYIFFLQMSYSRWPAVHCSAQVITNNNSLFYYQIR